VAQHADTMHVRRHLVRYRVAEGRTAPPARASLDGALIASLADRMAAVRLPGGDQGVWLIRRLDVKASVGSSWATDRVAQALAAGAAGALARTLERGADGDAVLWFPDRAAFLARFLLDLADGRAAGRWEYGEFEEVAGRATSVAIRAVVAREPGTAVDAMVRLTQADLRRLLARLAPPDADAVLGALATAAVPAAGDPASLVVDALGRSLRRAALPDEPHAAALAVFLDVARQGGSAPPTGTEARAREVVRLAAILRATAPEEAEGLARALAGGDWRAVGGPEMSRLAELVAWPADARREAVRLLVQARGGAPDRATGRRPPSLQTDLGGMFLLLPLLEELPWREATAGWPDRDGVDPVRLAQYLAVIVALGADRNAAAALDQVLRLALGIPPEAGAPAIAAWTRAIEPGTIRRSTEAFIGELRRLGKVSGAVTVAPLQDGVVAVDGARGIWLGTAPAAPASIRHLVASIDLALGRPAAITGSEAWIEACLEPARSRPDPIDQRLLDRLDEQARYATLGPPFDLAPEIRGMLTLAAQALGRELAWRLPGFSRSSLAYLSEHVLSFGATVVVEPTRYVVRVGDPPLHLVLSLAGMNRRRFRLDATGDREWVLTQAR
jgi:hypothetical protein